jgi:hypothetical protein
MIKLNTKKAFSDQFKSKWGRRKPFIIFGGLFGVIGMIIVSNIFKKYNFFISLQILKLLEIQTNHWRQ